ncbi:ABC transporter permease [Streptomyces sp. A7024]|uniref:ABC transporter permease n=1 Tax=Streptomyces coryli TaxID=1128680 RepID=A0A6G4TWD1_9ACTN|nr:ABC transporter permease [Streptomyces coryli]NGN63311.1 ABC transporter permease [Streptomyces coryli]
MSTMNRKTIIAMILVPVVIALALLAFVWPSARLAPRDLPVGVAGPPTATAQLAQQLGARGDAFDVTSYDTEAQAREAIKDRDIYGAFVVTQQGPKVLTATAASPTVAQLLTTAASEQAPPGTKVDTVDVVAAPKADPRGSALGSSVLPMALAGVMAGAVVTMMGLRGTRAVIALVGASAGIGLIGAAVADSWLGILAGDWWQEAGAFGLTALAGSAAVAGFAALIGPAGIGIGALFNVFLGNPFSGVTSAPEMLPQPVGMIGQWLPPGAGGQLLRSVAFFDGSAVTGPLIVLGAWSVGGLALIGLGSVIKRRRDDDGTKILARSDDDAVEPLLAMNSAAPAGQ